MSRCLALLLALSSSSCGPRYTTSVVVELACEPPETLALSVRVRSADLELDAGQRFDMASLPSQLTLWLEDRAGAVDIEAEGNGRVASGRVTTVPKEQVRLTLNLSPGVAQGPTCTDARQNGDEQDVDCGGSCPACNLGGPCSAPEQCSTRACAPQGFCTFASGPPSWRPLAALTPARSAVAGASAPDAVYAVGGLLDPATPLDLVSRYDADADVWAASVALPAPRSAAATAWLSGRLWVVGGDPTTTSVVSWAPGEAVWAQGPPLPHEHAGAGAAAFGGRLFVVGGQQGADVSRQVEVLQPDGGWTSGRSLPTGRRALALAAMSDGTLYALGGSDTAALRTVEQYFVASDAWSTAAAMPTARAELGAVQGPDGRLWAIGGASGASPLDTVEAYHPPPIDRWATLPFLSGQRAGHAVALAPDGRIVVFGGRGNAQAPTRAEAYGPVVTATATSVRGENFATRATVTISLAATGAVLASGTTDDAGVLGPVALPTLQAGTHLLRVVDHRSRYPVTVRVTAP